MAIDDVVPAVVTETNGSTIGVRFGPYHAAIDQTGFEWTGRSAAEQLVRPGDLVEVQITGLDTEEGTAEVTLEQEPEVEAALFALDNRTGRVLAMVGGYSFDRSKFNRATQANRQLGSLFKAALYAAAIDQGYTATSIIQDEPVSYDVGPEQDLYEPTNYDNAYEGPITLRYALEHSRNVPAVRMMNELGPEVVVDFARRLGFSSPIPPFLSVALGSNEATLLEVTSAYSVFPNSGIRMVPYLIERIEDREGDVLEDNRPSPRDAIRADTAYMMVSLMRGVVQRGTGRGALRLGWPVGGKTGTMDEYTDAWFVGFDPRSPWECGSATTRRRPSATVRKGPESHYPSGETSCRRISTGVRAARLPVVSCPLTTSCSGRSTRARVRSPSRGLLAPSRKPLSPARSLAPPSDSSIASPVPQRPCSFLHQVGLDELIEIAVQHSIDITHVHLGAVVLDHLIRV